MSSESRRNFLMRSAAGLAAAPAVLGSQANSALTLGVIGYGNRGSYVSGIFAKHESLRVTAVCDIFADKLEAAAQKFPGAKQYRDYKELLASGVDAVLIATPAFLHPEHFEAAVAARKHIFMEKPAGVTPAGCRKVIEAGKKADPSKRITVDYQQRYGKDYRKAYEVVKSGELGDIKLIRASWLGSGAPVKTGLPANEEKIRNWYFFRELSGDILVEQDCHNIDVVNWFTGSHPVRATGYGSRQIRQYGDVYDNLAATFQFANGVVFSYSADQFRTPGFQDVSETFVCEKGAVNVSRKGYTIWRGKQPPETASTAYDITEDNVREFIDGCLAGKLENTSLSAATSTLTALMALQAIVKGREMTWEEITKA
ncbi:MAG: Gfo/Idh/MocA family protein [Acidobacteriota bacterium]